MKEVCVGVIGARGRGGGWVIVVVVCQDGFGGGDVVLFVRVWYFDKVVVVMLCAEALQPLHNHLSKPVGPCLGVLELASGCWHFGGYCWELVGGQWRLGVCSVVLMMTNRQ